MMTSTRLAAFGLVPALLCGGAIAQSWVSPSGSDANPGTMAQPFQTINHAVSVASDGDTINLTAGVFNDANGQGIVTLGGKDLVLRGQGQGVTIIQASSSLTVIRDGGFTTSPVATSYRPVVLVEGSKFTQIRNLTLDGNFDLPASGRLYGMFVRGGADVLASKIDVINCRSNPLDNNQRPAGIVVRGDAGADPCNVTLNRSLVRDWGKVGVVAMFNSALTMDSNNVDGAGHIATLAQNGVQVAYGATGIIRNNTITDIYYSPLTTASAGVLGFEASDLSITDNFIGNSEGAIFVSSAAATTVVGEIRGNNTVVSRFAITMENVSGYSISGNICHILSDDFPAAFDNTANGNNWEANSYSDFDGTSPWPISGGTTDVDNSPRGDVNEFKQPPVITALSAAPEDLVTGEFNGDGMQDFITANSNGSPSLSVGLGNGDGTFNVTDIAFGNANGIASAIVAGNFDNAGGTDLAVATRNVPPAVGENKVYVFSGDGLGGFTLIHTEVLTFFASASNMAAGDLDGDNIDDIVLTDAGSPPLANGKAQRFLNDGTGTGWAISPLPIATVFPARGADIADVDGDGDNDIVVLAGNNFLGQWFYLEGFNNGVFNPTAQGLTNLNPAEVVIGDLDGDGDQDFVVASFRFGLDFGSVEFFDNMGGNVFVKTQNLVDQGPVALAMGNVDNDTSLDGVTRKDVAVASFVAGNTTLLGRYHRTGFSSGGIADTAGSPSGVSFGEFTSDLYEDLLIADASLKQIRVLCGRPSAVVELYGDGCPGTNGLIPTLVAIGLPPVPIQPNNTFGIRIENALPSTVAVFAAGLTPQPILIPCNLMIDNIIDTWWEITNGSGKASIIIPIPPTPVLTGAELFLQAGAFDPGNTTAFVPGFSLTPGMRLRVGTY